MQVAAKARRQRPAQRRRGACASARGSVASRAVRGERMRASVGRGTESEYVRGCARTRTRRRG